MTPVTSTRSSRGEIERKVAPAAADIEHPESRLKAQLGSDQAQLVALGLLQRVAVAQEVGAGVLQALVQEQPVEIVAEVVVVRDVLLRPADRVGLLEAAQAPRNPPQRLLQRIGARATAG